jgi:hypothetical protein
MRCFWAYHGDILSLDVGACKRCKGVVQTMLRVPRGDGARWRPAEGSRGVGFRLQSVSRDEIPQPLLASLFLWNTGRWKHDTVFFWAGEGKQRQGGVGRSRDAMRGWPPVTSDGAVGEAWGFAQLAVAGPGRRRRGRWYGFAQLTVAAPGRRSRDQAAGFAQLMVAGRDDGGVEEGGDSHNGQWPPVTGDGAGGEAWGFAQLTVAGRDDGAMTELGDSAILPPCTPAVGGCERRNSGRFSCRLRAAGLW